MPIVKLRPIYTQLSVAYTNLSLLLSVVYTDVSSNNMTTLKQTILLLTISVFGLTACKQYQATEVRADFKKYYDQFKVEGSFVLYDPQADKYIFYNQDQFEQTFSPASTYKVCRALLGLQTRRFNDLRFVIPWDSVTRHLQ